MSVYKQILCLTAVLCVVPFTATAETVLRVGSEATVGADQLVANDLYMSTGFFDRTVMSGDVSGDYVTVGSAVTIDGSVGGDILAGAVTVDIGASTTDDVRVVGGEVTIGGFVGGDLFVMAGSVDILPEATIIGDILVFAGDVTIAAPVGGSIFGATERIRIDASVEGNVEIKAPAGVTLGDNAAITGSLTYESRTELVRAQNSVVNGDIQERSIARLETENNAAASITPLFILLFSALSLYLLFKRQLQHMSRDILAHPLITGGIGAGCVFAGPIVAAVLALTVLALPLGVALAGVLLVLYALGIVVAGIVLGLYGARWLFGTTVVTLPVVVGGCVVLYALLFVPVIGVVVTLVAYLVAIGALVRFVARKLATQ